MTLNLIIEGESAVVEDAEVVSNPEADRLVAHANLFLQAINGLNVNELHLVMTTAIDSLGASRELSLSKTKFEEGVLWLGRHFTLVEAAPKG